jgi:hypothetical protein
MLGPAVWQVMQGNGLKSCAQCLEEWVAEFLSQEIWGEADWARNQPRPLFGFVAGY